MFDHLIYRVTADEDESFSLVAELDSGVKVVSGRTRFRAVDCRKQRPTMEKIKAQQVV